MNVTIVKSHDLRVSAPDRVGLLAEVAGRCKEAGINILGICAYQRDNNAHLVLHTSDAIRTAQICADMSVIWQEVIEIECEAGIGVLAEIAGKLAQVGINIIYCYATAGDAPRARLVMDTTHNDRAMETLCG
jgi:hypothetical protein